MDAPVVSTTAGKVRGAHHGTSYAFRGIPTPRRQSAYYDCIGRHRCVPVKGREPGAGKHAASKGGDKERQPSPTPGRHEGILPLTV